MVDRREVFIKAPKPPYFGWAPYFHAGENDCDVCYNVIKGGIDE